MALLTLAEAKESLDLAAVTTYDVELQDYIDGAEEAVLFICGAATSTAVTDVIQAAGAIALNKTPVLTVTSVTGDCWGARTVGDLHVNLDTGVIRAKGNLLPLAEDTYTVVYTTGRATAPAAMKQAAKVILKHQWSTQRGPSSKRTPTSDDSSYVPGLGYAVPNVALQMLAPFDRGPAVG